MIIPLSQIEKLKLSQVHVGNTVQSHTIWELGSPGLPRCLYYLILERAQALYQLNP